MKKKRFLRLVMSYGFQRNEAARIAAAFGGVDIAAGEDQSVVVHHVQSGGAPSVQAMTQEKHEAAHAAGRLG